MTHLLKPVLLISLLFFSACNIISLNPFYNSDSVVFKQELLGRWTDEAGKYEITLNKGNGGSYSVLFVESGVTSRFNAILFKVKDQYFADISPVYETGKVLFDSTVIGCHVLAKCKFNGEQIIAQIFSEEFYTDTALNVLPSANRQIITNSSNQLFSFIEKKLDTPDSKSALVTLSKLKAPVPAEPKTSGGTAGDQKAS